MEIGGIFEVKSWRIIRNDYIRDEGGRWVRKEGKINWKLKPVISDFQKSRSLLLTENGPIDLVIGRSNTRNSLNEIVQGARLPERRNDNDYDDDWW